MIPATLRCACGMVEGRVDVSIESVNRLVCYCDDCQLFARFLGRTDVMNDRGGTDIVQVAPSRMQITKGIEHLRSMRLSEKGLFRWYTQCCKTPAGNMLYTPKCPMVGIPIRFWALNADELDRVVGRSRAGIHGRFAIGGCPEGVDESATLGVVFRSMTWLLGNFVRRLYAPSPFWNSSGQPIVAPQVLTEQERKQIPAALRKE